MDYKRAVVIDTGPKKYDEKKTLFGVSGEVRSKNNLTEPALLEMSGNATYQELAFIQAPIPNISDLPFRRLSGVRS